MKMRTLTLWMLFIATSLHAAIPQSGIQAESEGRWLDAANIYEMALEYNPAQIDLYLRLSDIYAKLQQPELAANPLQRALIFIPENAQLHARLSSTYASNQKPVEALKSIQKAVSLEPKNPQYLRSQAQLANWSKDYALAAQSNDKLLQITNDNSLLIHIARSEAWDGQIDRAAEDYQQYLDHFPDDQSAYLDYAKTQIWRGNYTRSEALLDEHDERFSMNPTSQKLRAEIYARSDWPDAARNLIEPLLEQNPNDYQLNYNQTIALHNDHQTQEAIDSLSKIESLKPDTQETEDLRKLVQTNQRSYVALDGIYFEDKDNIEKRTLMLYGKYRVKPETLLYIGAEHDRLRTAQASPFLAFDGSKSVDISHLGLGITHRFNDTFEADLMLGNTETDFDSMPFGRVKLRFDMMDKNTLFLNLSHDYLLISPLSASLGVERTHLDGQLVIRPDLKHTLIMVLEHDWYSPDNRRWSVTFAPRRAIKRSQSLNLDAGVKAWVFSFDNDLNDGYYDPDLFESYLLTLFATYKFSQENELNLQAGAGLIKDETFDDYEFGSNIDLLATFGIYKDWQLQARTGYLNNERETTNDAYDAFYFGLNLRRRF